MSEKNSLLHSFNGIPYDEEVVPFPNFGAVIFQHKRALGEKTSIEDNSICWSFADVNNWILKLQNYFDEIGVGEKDVIGLSFGNSPIEILMLFALLFKGAIIQPIFPIYSKDEADELFEKSKAKIIFDFNSESKINYKNSQLIKFSNHKEFISKIKKYSEKESLLPYLRLKDPALRFYEKGIGVIEFNQYNLLTAAQSIGKKFHLFRPGISILNHKIQDLTDFIYSVFAPFYYGKTIKIDEQTSDENIFKNMSEGKIHYSYLGTNFEKSELTKIEYSFNNILRDAAVVINVKNKKTAFRFSEHSSIVKVFGDNISCGVGLIFDENGNGKCMDNIEVAIVDNDGEQVFSNTKGKLAFRGHTIFDNLLTKNIDDCNSIKNGWFITNETSETLRKNQISFN